MKFVAATKLSELTPEQQAIVAGDELTNQGLLLLAERLHLKDSSLPSFMLSVAATFLVRTAATIMAVPEFTEPMCEWVKAFAAELPARVAQASTAKETKQ